MRRPDFRFWPKADMRPLMSKVRFRGQSRHEIEAMAGGLPPEHRGSRRQVSDLVIRRLKPRGKRRLRRIHLSIC